MKLEIQKIPSTEMYLEGNFCWTSERMRAFEGIVLAPQVPLQLKVQKSGTGRITLTGKAMVDFEATCGRCLQPLKESLILPLAAEFEPLWKGQITDAWEREELYRANYEGQDVDLEEMLLEHIFPNLPTKLLCKEDCKGLCPSCGQNLNQASCACEEVAEEEAESHSPFAILSQLKFEETKGR